MHNLHFHPHEMHSALPAVNFQPFCHIRCHQLFSHIREKQDHSEHSSNVEMYPHNSCICQTSIHPSDGSRFRTIIGFTGLICAIVISLFA